MKVKNGNRLRRVQVCAHVCSRARAREAGAQVADKGGASGRGRHRRSSTQSGARARFFEELSRRAALCCVSRRVARGMVFRLRRARAACVDVQKAGPSAGTNGTGLYKQLPGRQISGLRSCRDVSSGVVLLG